MIESLLYSFKVLLTSLTTVAVVANSGLGAFSPVVKNAVASLNTSRNWAGYVASGGKFSSVSGTWVIPTVTPGNNFSADATWVGIGGVASKDLIQSGTQATIGRDGQVYYQAWLELLPSSQKVIPVLVNAGDSVSVIVANTEGNLWQIDFKDNTTNQSYQTQVSYTSSLSSADWVEEAPTSIRGIIPLDNFGTVQFSNATTIKDGQQMSVAQAGGKAVTMGSFNQVLASASDLSADGTTFSISRSDVASVAQPINPQIFRTGGNYRIRVKLPQGSRFFSRAF